MPFAGFEDFESCLADQDLLKRYPDAETRKRVCGAMKARLEHAQAGEAAVDAAEHSAPTRVEETTWAWLIRDMVATRVGVNDQGLYKDPASVEQTARSLDGAAVVYEHPIDADGSWVIDVDPKAAPGIAVNARVDGDAVLYDALVWKRNPPGHNVTDSAIATNATFAAAVRSGQAVHNSVGAHNLELLEAGVAPRMGSGVPTPYRAKLVRAEVGHIAILAPVAGMKGGSCPLPWCGAVPGREQEADEQDAVKCGCVDKAAERVAEAHKVSKGAALLAIRDAANGKA